MALGHLGVAGGDASPCLEPVDQGLDGVPLFGESGVMAPGRPPVACGRRRGPSSPGWPPRCGACADGRGHGETSGPCRRQQRRAGLGRSAGHPGFPEDRGELRARPLSSSAAVFSEETTRPWPRCVPAASWWGRAVVESMLTRGGSPPHPAPSPPRSPLQKRREAPGVPSLPEPVGRSRPSAEPARHRTPLRAGSESPDRPKADARPGFPMVAGTYTLVRA